MVIVKRLLTGILLIALLSLALIIPAGVLPGGTWLWERAIFLLIIYGVLLEGLIFYLTLVKPGERGELFEESGEHRGGKLFIVIVRAVFLLSFAAIPLDVFHLKLLPAPLFKISLLGGMLSLLGFALTAVALYHDSHSAPIEVNEGEWAVHCHLYAGPILWMAGVDIWLGSFAGLAFVFIFFLSFLLLIFVEERALRETVTGYIKFRGKIRYRLIPFVY